MESSEIDEPRKEPGKANHLPKLLSPADLPDNFTRSLYKIAPYKGCAHGCRYCDGRAERYYIEGDFERDIEIRQNIPGRLAAELPIVRERGMIAFGSGVTDPYQPLESDNTITSRCAQLLAESPHALPALVMTKSNLATRDLPFWKRLNERTGFVLLVSLTSLDESLRETMEPGASSFASRLDMIRRFKVAGCSVGVLAMPFLPGLSDGEDSIRTLYAACTIAGVDFVMPGGLTLRPGRQKEFYLRALNSYRPELLGPTSELYREEHSSGSPCFATSRALFTRIAPIRREFAMPYLLPHKIFSRILPPHDSIRILFRDMLELYAERNIDIGALARSAKAYDAWLISLRRVFRRKRNLPYIWLGERFNKATIDGELDTILGNKRLSRFVTTILHEGACLDYLTLKLEQNP
ncbi:MAG: radical SAM protein [Rectinemataceae bacterium]